MRRTVRHSLPRAVLAIVFAISSATTGCKVPQEMANRPVSDLSFGWFAGLHGDSDRVTGAELKHELDNASFWDVTPNRLFYGSTGVVGGFAAPIAIAVGSGGTALAGLILVSPVTSAAGLVWGINAAMIADSMRQATIKRGYLDELAKRQDPRVRVGDLVAFKERNIARAAVVEHMQRYGTTKPTREEAIRLVNFEYSADVKYAFDRLMRQDIAKNGNPAIY